MLYCLSRGLTLAAAVVRGRHQLFYVKLPNILGLDQRPFDRDTFEAADEDELVEGPEGTHCPPACRAPASRDRRLPRLSDSGAALRTGQKMKPLPPETIMRWRLTTDKYGQQVPANTRARTHART